MVTHRCPVALSLFRPLILTLTTHAQIRMGFGLHVGWAIEGAIGSAFKIDATYISPHVAMADRLEAGTKVFNVPLVMSEWFVGLLSPAARAFLRRLDCIKVRGCSVPFTVYTFDMTTANCS